MFYIFYYVADKKFAIGDDRPLGKRCFRQDVKGRVVEDRMSKVHEEEVERKIKLR